MRNKVPTATVVTATTKTIKGVEYTRPVLSDFKSPQSFLLAMLRYVSLDTSSRAINKRALPRTTSPSTVHMFVNGNRLIGCSWTVDLIARGLLLTDEERQAVEAWAFDEFKRRMIRRWFTKEGLTHGNSSEAA